MEESSVNEEKIISIEIERLKDFKDHPFRVRSDRDMQKLLASIKQYGILSPLIVRPIPEGVYEIISGHRRKYAAQQLGYRKVPVIIRAMKDDEAVISMIDANLQREQIRPSEKAFAYKMKYDAIKRRSGRRKKDAIDYNLDMKMTIKLAYAIIFYVAISFEIFESTFVEHPSVCGEKKIDNGPAPEDIYHAISYQDDFCKWLLFLSREKLGLDDKDVPRYPELLKKVNTDKITLIMFKDAANLLVEEMNLRKRDIDDVGKIIDY